MAAHSVAVTSKACNVYMPSYFTHKNFISLEKAAHLVVIKQAVFSDILDNSKSCTFLVNLNNFCLI